MLRLMLQNLDLHRFGSCKYHWEAPWIGCFFIHRSTGVYDEPHSHDNGQSLCGYCHLQALWCLLSVRQCHLESLRRNVSLLGMVLDGSKPTFSGWWFGTWILWLSIYWACHHPNWRTPSFFRGVGIPPTFWVWLASICRLFSKWSTTIFQRIKHQNCFLPS